MPFYQETILRSLKYSHIETALEMAPQLGEMQFLSGPTLPSLPYPLGLSGQQGSIPIKSDKTQVGTNTLCVGRSVLVDKTLLSEEPHLSVPPPT